MPPQDILECLNQQRFIVSIWRHLLVVHLQVDYGVSSPIVPFELRDLELGWHCHVGEPRHAGEVCVPERVQALHEPDLFLQAINLVVYLGVFPFRLWWCWWRWSGIGVRMSVLLLVVGIFVVFLLWILVI